MPIPQLRVEMGSKPHFHHARRVARGNRLGGTSFFTTDFAAKTARFTLC
jgi:hypothetical protein